MRSLFPLLVVLFVVFRLISAIITASKKGSENEAQVDETEEQKRMREIQERIRKKIAERRGGVVPLAPRNSQPSLCRRPCCGRHACRP